jgi:hypothetical protein
MYIYYGGNVSLINKHLPVKIRYPVQFAHYLSKVALVGNENILRSFVQNYNSIPHLTTTEYLRRRDCLDGKL